MRSSGDDSGPRGASTEPARAAYSVALRTYRGARYIEEQLRTIVDAVPPPAEVVVIDDASTDRTVDVVRATLADWPGDAVVDVNPVNAGSLRSFERAMRRTTRPIVFLADQDDAWYPDKPARILDLFASRPDLLLLHSDARIVDDDRQPLGYSLFDALEATRDERDAIHHGDAFDAFIRRNLATGATLAFRRSLLDAALPIPDEWVHDEWIALIASAIGAVDFVDDALIDYRQHAHNQIGARRLDLRAKVEKAFEKAGDYYSRHLRRTDAALERLIALGSAVPPDRLDKLRAKRAHLVVRAALPDNRIARTVPIAREWLSGGYHHYSTGMKSVVRDLFHRL